MWKKTILFMIGLVIVSSAIVIDENQLFATSEEQIPSYNMDFKSTVY